MVIQTEQNLEKIPDKIKWSFDKGYYESHNIKFLDDKRIGIYSKSKEKS